MYKLALSLQGYDSVKILTEASVNSGEDVWGPIPSGLNLTGRIYLALDRLVFKFSPLFSSDPFKLLLLGVFYCFKQIYMRKERDVICSIVLSECD